ncbi:MAG: hypothetical protein M1840_000649 [Geoglossum simile]|nr:MAG: hypothetical protein M1840_000649 [Geoglossum simile]
MPYLLAVRLSSRGSDVVAATDSRKRFGQSDAATSLILRASLLVPYNSSQNFTILDLQMIGDPEIQSLRASEYKEIWDKIFIANSLSSVDDKTMIASLTWSLGWLMRHYDDDYPDDNATPLVHLQNFLAIPIQFTIACIIYANSTLNLDTPLFRLPNEMITTALGGMSIQRFVGQTWTLAVFIAAGGTLILLALAILLWMITQKAALPSISGIPEIDIMVRAENSTTGERIDGLESLREAVETRRLIEAKWPYRMA